MIAKLKGTLDSFSADHAVIDVGGVGYLVFASTRTLSALGAIGADVVLHTQMQVAEDDIRLIGFATAAERDWFRLLTSVQGVGARVALAILSALSAEEVHRAVAAGDNAMIARAQGVGPKLAQRIVNELRDKAGTIALGLGGAAPGLPRPAASAPTRRRRSRTSASARPRRRRRSSGRRRSSAAARRSTPSSARRSRRRRSRPTIMNFDRPERRFPPVWRVIAAFLIAPGVAALILAAVMPAYPGLDDPLERVLRTAWAIATIGAYPATVVLGLPAFFMLRRRFDPKLTNCSLTGAVVAVLPWALLSLLSTPDQASVNGRATVIDGSNTAFGWLMIGQLLGQIALAGAVAGALFWAIAAAGSGAGTSGS
jgi:Holliday junction DNA helicase RuvA